MKYAEFKSGNHIVEFFCSNLTEETVRIDGKTVSRAYILQNKSHVFTLNNELFALSTKYTLLSSATVTVTLAKEEQIIDVKTIPLDKMQRYLWLGIGILGVLWLLRILS